MAKDVGNYLATKAPNQVTAGTRVLQGQYVDDLGRVQPWVAHYDEYGRLVGRTDYNAGNITQDIPTIIRMNGDLENLRLNQEVTYKENIYHERK